MKIASLEAIAHVLDDAEVRYLVAGGLAVNAHGYLRATFDVDLIIQLKPENIIPTFRALATIGYKPMVPVTAEDFANPDKRQEWIQEKGMKVLNFHSNQHEFTRLDIFVYEPFDFDDEYKKSLYGEIVPGLFVHFVSIPILIEMKKIANRPRDIDDIEHLQMILDEEEKK